MYVKYTDASAAPLPTDFLGLNDDHDNNNIYYSIIILYNACIAAGNATTGRESLRIV